MESHRPSSLRHRLAVVAAAAIFSTGGAGIKATSLDGWQVASGRSAIAALVLGLAYPEARRHWSFRTLAVGGAFAATLVLFVLGNKHTSGANTIFLQSAAPLYLLLVAPRVLGERIGGREAALMGALALGLGLFYLDAAPASGTAPRPLLGNALATAAGVTWAMTLAGLRWLEAREGGAGMRSVVAGNLLAAVVALAPALGWSAHGPSGLDVAVVAYLGVVQIGLAYVLLTFGLRGVGAFEGSLLLLAEPALSPLLTWWLHGERPGPLALTGGATILLASTGKSWLERRRSAPA